MKEKEQKLLEDKKIKKSGEINDGKNNIAKSQNGFKGLIKALLIAGLVGGAGVTYKTVNANGETNPSSVDVNKSDSKIEKGKIYNSSALFKEFFNLYENQSDISKVYFSQKELDSLLLTYSKSLIGENFAKEVDSVLKEMIFAILGEGYEVQGHKDLDKLRKNIILFTGGEYNVEYSGMPKNTEFKGKIVVYKSISGNTITLKKANKFNTLLEYFDTRDNVINNASMLSLVDAFLEDRSSGDEDLGRQTNSAISKMNFTSANLTLARSKIRTLEDIIKRLNNQIAGLKKDQKIEILDLIDKYNTELKKQKNRYTKIIAETNKENVEKLASEKDKNKALYNDKETVEKALDDTKTTLESTINEFNQLFNKTSLKNSDLEIKNSELKDREKNYEEQINELRSQIDELLEKITNKDQEKEALENTIGLNSLKFSTKNRRLEKELRSTKRKLENYYTKLEEKDKKIKELKEETYVSRLLSKIINSSNIRNTDSMIIDLNSQIITLNKKIKNIKYSNTQKKDFKTRIKAFYRIIGILETIKTNSLYKTKLDSKSKKFENLETKYSQSENNIISLARQVKKLKAELKSKNSTIKNLANTIDGIKIEMALEKKGVIDIDKYNEYKNESKQEIGSLKKIISDLKNKFSNLKEASVRQVKEIRNLKGTINNYKNKENTRNTKENKIKKLFN